jgi:hypothetical protein
MMSDPVPELADAVEPTLNVSALYGPTRKDFDHVIPPEHVILWPGQTRPETEGEFSYDPSCVEWLSFLYTSAHN